MIALGSLGFRVTIVVYVFMGVNLVIRQLETSMYNYNIDVQNVEAHYIPIKRHKLYVYVFQYHNCTKVTKISSLFVAKQ